jgi:hypothetical protein
MGGDILKVGDKVVGTHDFCRVNSVPFGQDAVGEVTHIDPNDIIVKFNVGGNGLTVSTASSFFTDFFQAAEHEPRTSATITCPCGEALDRERDLSSQRGGYVTCWRCGTYTEV